MVKVTTLEGLELILENEFPCILNHPAEPKIELIPDSITGEITTSMETTVDKVLYVSEKIDFENNEKINANAVYDVKESANYIADKLMEENINFTAYNLE